LHSVEHLVYGGMRGLNRWALKHSDLCGLLHGPWPIKAQ
jgi:hypothetical protein